MMLPSLVGIVAVALKEIYKCLKFRAECRNIITINVTMNSNPTSIRRELTLDQVEDCNRL